MVNKKTKGKGKKISMWQIATAVLAVLLIATIFINYQGNTKTVSADDAAMKAIGYINTNMLVEGIEAELVSVEQKGALYYMVIRIDNKDFDTYISLDGNGLLPTYMDLNTVITE